MFDHMVESRDAYLPRPPYLNQRSLHGSQRNGDRDNPVNNATIFPEESKNEPLASKPEEECYICVERKCIVITSPCRHSAGCVTCCRALKESGAKASSGKHLCPECRGEVVQFIKVFV